MTSLSDVLFLTFPLILWYIFNQFLGWYYRLDLLHLTFIYALILYLYFLGSQPSSATNLKPSPPSTTQEITNQSLKNRPDATYPLSASSNDSSAPKRARSSSPATILQRSKSQKIQSKITEMKRRFLSMIEDPSWELILDNKQELLANSIDSKKYPLKIYKHSSSPFAFKVETTLPTTAATALDLTCNTAERPSWDSMCEEGKIVEDLGSILGSNQSVTRIIYLKLAAMFMIKARDILLLSHICRITKSELGASLGILEGKGNTFLNVTSSHDYHPQAPERSDEGIIRATTEIAGQLFIDLKHSSTCKMIQLNMNADPKGWIPKSAISFATTKAIPNAINRLNKTLIQLPRLAEPTCLPRNSESESVETVGSLEGPLDYQESPSEKSEDSGTNLETKNDDIIVEELQVGNNSVQEMNVISNRIKALEETMHLLRISNELRIETERRRRSSWFLSLFFSPSRHGYSFILGTFSILSLVSGFVLSKRLK